MLLLKLKHKKKHLLPYTVYPYAFLYAFPDEFIKIKETQIQNIYLFILPDEMLILLHMIDTNYLNHFKIASRNIGSRLSAKTVAPSETLS